MCVEEEGEIDTVPDADCSDSEEVDFGRPRDWLKATVWFWSMYGIAWATAWMVTQRIEQRETSGEPESMETVGGISASMGMPDAAIGVVALVAILLFVLGGLFGTVATIGLVCSTALHGSKRLAAYWRGENHV